MTRGRLATRFMASNDKCNRRGPKRKDVDFETQIGL
jgi:hypothetical protein